MTTVSELRHELVALGMSKNEADSIVGKDNMVNKIEELKVNKDSEDIFNDKNVVVEDDQGVAATDEVVNNTNEPPEMTDPRWAEYVLSHLEENEKIKGHPKADSLRRLTELLIGTIVQIKTKVLQCPNMENGGRATVVVSITVESNFGILQASGAADVGPGNTETLFARFPVATAETRAEGRAYRKMLRLINVVTAEELVDDNDIVDTNNIIDSAQITMISQMCSSSKLNIDVEALLKQYDIKVEKLDRLSRSKAQEICKIISSYQETGVPENLVGYKENWR